MSSDTKNNNDTIMEDCIKKEDIAISILMDPNASPEQKRRVVKSESFQLSSPSNGDDPFQFSPSSESDESSVSSFDLDEFHDGIPTVLANSRYTMIRAA